VQTVRISDRAGTNREQKGNRRGPGGRGKVGPAEPRNQATTDASEKFQKFTQVNLFYASIRNKALRQVLQQQEVKTASFYLSLYEPSCTAFLELFRLYLILKIDNKKGLPEVAHSPRDCANRIALIERTYLRNNLREQY